MPTLELTIQRVRDGAWPVVAELAAADGGLPARAEGWLTLDRSALSAEALDQRAYGERLGQALLAGPVRDAFAAALAAAPEGQTRLLLAIEDPELAGLRWERLCGPVDGAWRPLALSRRVLYSRYQPSLADRRFPPIGRRDLRALVLAASPAGLARFGLAPFDAAAAADGVARALGPIPLSRLADTQGAAGPPSLEALCRQIVAEAPTLLHLVCHGRALDDGESVLYLARDDDPAQVAPLPATLLIERLASLDGARGLPHLIFLASCESATPAAAGAMGNLAQRLVRDLGTPAVVAMADRVSVETAEALAAAFYPRLAEHGHPDQALAEALAALQGRADALVPGLYGRIGGRPLFSDSLARPLTPNEIRDGLARLPALIEARAPILAPELDAAAHALRGTLGVEAQALSPELRHEREAALAQVGTICEEATELSFAAIALGRQPQPYQALCPFPGLAAFQADEGRFFFGREALVERLAARLAARPFLAILGPSGSGKSSVARAGLLPALKARRPGLAVTTFTPGARPRERLRAALAADLRGAQPGPRLILVDQLEELFTLCADEGERRAFSEQLLALAGKALVVVTMRADFWGEVAPYMGLREAMQAHQELIGPLTPAELRSAIEQQAAAVGLRFEAGLGGQILDDVAGEPGAMPLLQHALAELWKRRRGRWLRAAEYQSIGGVARAIAHTADGIYLGLGDAERERLRDSFVRLTRLDPDAGDGPRRDTRRRVALAELVPAGGDPAAVRELVLRLADARLVVTSVGTSGAQEVEVAHEALIRAWPRLQGWLSEDRQSLRVREGVRQAAIEWDEAARDESRLVHRGARLDEAAAVAAQPRFAPNARERAYLDACLDLRRREREQEEEERQRELKAAQDLAAAQALTVRRTRRLARAIAAVAVLAVVAAAFALFQTNEARRRAESERLTAEQAERAARRARGGELAALAERAGTARPQQRLLLAIEAVRATRDFGDTAVAPALEALYTALGEVEGEALPLVSAFPDWQSAALGLMAVSPDARHILTMRNAEQGWLWDATAPDAAARPVQAEGVTLTQVSFSPDGRWLASASREAAHLWDLTATDLRPVELLRKSWEDQLGLAFSPTGDRLAIAGADGLHLFGLDAAGPTKIAHDPELALTAVAFSPDGALIAGGGPVVSRLWTVEPFATQQDLSTEGAWLDNLPLLLAFSPDGRWLHSAVREGQDVLWDLVEGGPPQEGLGCGGSAAMLLSDLQVSAFTPDGSHLITNSCYARVGPPLERPPRSLDPQNEANRAAAAFSLAYSADGASGAIGMGDGRIVLVSLIDEIRAVETLIGHEARVLGLAFTPDNTALVSVDATGHARRWPLDDAARRGEPRGLPFDPRRPPNVSADGAAMVAYPQAGTPYDLAITLLDGPTPTSVVYTLPGDYDAGERALVSTDGRRMVTAVEGDGPPPTVWDLDRAGAATLRRELDAVSRMIGLSPDGRWLAVEDDRRQASLIDLEQQQAGGATPLTNPDEQLWHLTFSPDSSAMVSSAGTGEVNTTAVWRLDSDGPQLLTTLETDGITLERAAFSATGDRLVANLNGDPVRIWEPGGEQPGRLLREMTPVAGESPAVAISADGQLVATSGPSGAVLLYDLSAGEAPPRELRGHAGLVTSLAFSGDGWLASVDTDGAARLWDLAQSDPVAGVIMPLGDEQASGVLFLPDRRLITLVFGELGERLLLWTRDVDTLLDEACALAGRNLSLDEWARTFPRDAYRPTCPQLPPHPDLAVEQLGAARDALIGEELDPAPVAEARAAIDAALAIEPRLVLPTDLLRDLCAAGIFTARVRDVLDPCGQLVLRDGLTPEHRELRGIARALTGDPAGAADDLMIAAEARRSRGDEPETITEREVWAAELRAGRNPFTPELIERLREELQVVG